jgi:uncharacterized protein YqjF (DUF2071 family)
MDTALLTGKWKKIVMIHYPIDPRALLPYIPHGTKLHYWNDQCFVTLSAYAFQDIHIMGYALPLLNNYYEINFRFYVIPENDNTRECGVVYLNKHVNASMISAIGNALSKSLYTQAPIEYDSLPDYKNNHQIVHYQWMTQQNHSVRVNANKELVPIQRDGIDNFFVSRQRVYSKVSHTKTRYYLIQHPVWDCYPVNQTHVEIEFDQLYGKAFRILNFQNPAHVMMAEGSSVAIMPQETMQPVTQYQPSTTPITTRYHVNA